jgi:hypothetical protein
MGAQSLERKSGIGGFLAGLPGTSLPLMATDRHHLLRKTFSKGAMVFVIDALV